ncbi:MAG: hypothetical protein J2P17_23625 [Mycobacterium sp.]|nr:hypothetical protein [Mycobacterium sp.]
MHCVNLLAGRVPGVAAVYFVGVGSLRAGHFSMRMASHMLVSALLALGRPLSLIEVSLIEGSLTGASALAGGAGNLPRRCEWLDVVRRSRLARA